MKKLLYQARKGLWSLTQRFIFFGEVDYLFAEELKDFFDIWVLEFILVINYRYYRWEFLTAAIFYFW